MNEQRQFDIIDLISVISLFVGVSNLYENRQQSADNDVNQANDAQAKYLIRELSKRFDSLQETLDKILEEVKTNGAKF